MKNLQQGRIEHEFQPDYLEYLRGNIPKDDILKTRKALWENKTKRFSFSDFYFYDNIPQAEIRVFNTPIIKLNSDNALDLETREELLSLYKNLIPWKKGPFELFGQSINSEWRSDLKWERFLPHISTLENHIVADIGSHNGYFMYRMLPFKPKLVLGFEPVIKPWVNFQVLQRIARSENLYTEFLGVEHFGLFPEVFDTVFCLGILYHHTDPVQLLRMIHQSLKPGGTLFLDCQGIGGEDPFVLVPAGKYAGAGGFWNLPTEQAIFNWLKRTNFREIQIFFNDFLDPSEQRSTDWAPIKSLADFLNPENPRITIEGYPAPRRIYAKAKK